jgi:hypothetical protein
MIYPVPIPNKTSTANNFLIRTARAVLAQTSAMARVVPDPINVTERADPDPTSVMARAAPALISVMARADPDQTSVMARAAPGQTSAMERADLDQTKRNWDASRAIVLAA